MRADAWAQELRRAPAYPEERIAALVDAIRYGVPIGFTGARTGGLLSKNSRTTDDERVADLITKGIVEDVRAGWKRGPFPSPPFSPFWVSPLSAVPKGEDGQGIRIIHNLSHPFGGNSVNAGIEREEYLMQRFEDALAAIRRLGRGTLLSKFDVRAAFKLVPVRPEDRALLGLRWKGDYYFEVVLPFGLRTSGYRWEEFAAALHFLFERHLGVEVVFHYVDDFLLLAAPGEHARAARERAALESLCAHLGVPIADEKTTGPATTVVFLGIFIDTQLMECRLTDKRVSQLRKLLQDWGSGAKHFDCEEIMSLVGKLEFACVVVRAGTAFLRRIRGVMMDMKRARDSGAPSSNRKRLSVEAQLDVRWWLDVFLTSAGNRRSIYEEAELRWDDPALQIFTDACDTGYGARYGNRWFQGKWNAAQLAFAHVHTRISMPYLELHALTHAAVVWGPLWRNKRIVFRCDAEAAVRAVERMRSRKDSMSALLRLLYATAAKNGFLFRCVHIAGKSNVVADVLSRGCSLQELRLHLPHAAAQPTPAPPLDLDAEEIVPFPDPMEDPPPQQR